MLHDVIPTYFLSDELSAADEERAFESFRAKLALQLKARRMRGKKLKYRQAITTYYYY